MLRKSWKQRQPCWAVCFWGLCVFIARLFLSILIRFVVFHSCTISSRPVEYSKHTVNQVSDCETETTKPKEKKQHFAFALVQHSNSSRQVRFSKYSELVYYFLFVRFVVLVKVFFCDSSRKFRILAGKIRNERRKTKRKTIL